MTIGFTDKAVAHLTAEIAIDATQISIYKAEYNEVLSAQGDHVYLLLRGPINRELVKIDLSTSLWGQFLNIERGQGGTIAAAWPQGSMLCATTHEDHYNAIAQTGDHRTIDYNPNDVLSPLFAGEKVYQSTVGYQRWWKSFNGVNPYWDIITGAVGEKESYKDTGWTYELLTTDPEVWETAGLDDTFWELEFPNYGLWIGFVWASVNISRNLRIYLKALGAWNVGYEPTKVRLTIGGNDTAIHFNMKFGTQVHIMSSQYHNLEEIDINPDWYDDGPLNVIQLYGGDSFTPNFSLPKIEFVL